MDFDANGQPRNDGLHRKRLTQDRIAEMTGLLRGVIADGDVNQNEAEYVLAFMQANREHLNEWPWPTVLGRLVEMLADGKLDHEEQGELLALIAGHVGPGVTTSVVMASSELLYDDPPPALVFGPETVVVLTGNFECGSRKEVDGLLRQLGCNMAKAVHRKVTYLIVGEIGSNTWKQSTHGTKITEAFEARAAGSKIAVVSERHFIAELKRLGVID